MSSPVIKTSCDCTFNAFQKAKNYTLFFRNALAPYVILMKIMKYYRKFCLTFTILTRIQKYLKKLK